MNWDFAVAIGLGGAAVGALFGLLLAESLPRRSDERTRSDSEQQ